MRPLLPVLVALATLAAAPSSVSAKGIANGQVCGEDGCHSVAEASYFALMADGRPTDPPPTAAPFVTVRVTLRGEGPAPVARVDSYDYLPSLGVSHASGAPASAEWVRLDAEPRAALDAVVRDIAARPAAQLDGLPQPTTSDGGSWWALGGAGLAGLASLALLARYATSVLKARPRASKSAN